MADNFVPHTDNAQDMGTTAKTWKDAYLTGDVKNAAGAAKYSATGHTHTGYVATSLYDANSILAANSDDTPAAVTIAEDRLVGRLAGGNIGALTAAQVATLIGAVTFSYENNTAVAADPNVITTAENGKVFSNAGASALNCHTLPAAAANLEYTFYSPSSYGCKITAGANDKTSFGSSATKDGGYIQLAQYAWVRLKTIEIAQGSYDWVVLSWSGSITLETA